MSRNQTGRRDRKRTVESCKEDAWTQGRKEVSLNRFFLLPANRLFELVNLKYRTVRAHVIA